MTTRFSEAEAAEIDAARGSTDRSVWLRNVALAAARPPGRKPLPAGAIPVITDERVPPGVVGMVSRGPDGETAVGAYNIGTGTVSTRTFPAKCEHRLPPGTFCKTCGHTKT
jgi:hypothetical protein